MSRLLKVVGFDPSLNNWGIAKGTMEVGRGLESLRIEQLDVVQPEIPTGKQVRQNSKDIEAASQLTQRAFEYARGADAIFVEVPVGSQSARSMASYGICVGVLGALRTSGIPFFEVSPTEVKLSSFGIRTATKKQMISWATNKHPEAPWPTYKRGGAVLISESNAEHMADATAAIYAGVSSQPFQQMIRLMT